jgi:hypothetical protein
LVQVLGGREDVRAIRVPAKGDDGFVLQQKQRIHGHARRDPISDLLLQA